MLLMVKLNNRNKTSWDMWRHLSLVVVFVPCLFVLTFEMNFVFVTFQLLGMQTKKRKKMEEAWLDWFCLLLPQTLKRKEENPIFKKSTFAVVCVLSYRRVRCYTVSFSTWIFVVVTSGCLFTVVVLRIVCLFPSPLTKRD